MTKTAASDFLYRDMNSMMKPEQEEEDDEEESWWRMRNDIVCVLNIGKQQDNNTIL
jgi:hypothetical protein